MTNIYKLPIVLLVLIVCNFFLSCEHNVTEPAGQKTKVQFTFQKTNHNFYGKGWRRGEHSSERSKNISFTTKETLSKTNEQIDEVKVLCLDMTQWYDVDEFIKAWNATEQYSLFDTTLWDDSRDDWENISLTLKSYTGDFYQVVGELNLSIIDSIAKGTINLNPGLNYFLYCFRSGGTTVYINETDAEIVEGEDNVVRLDSSAVDFTPEIPGSPYPVDGATGVSTSVTLNWECYDAESDTLTYYIYFGTESDPPYYSMTNENSYILSGLSAGTTYHWKIEAYDADYNSSEGPVWSFTTGGSSSIPAAPTLYMPADRATDQPTSLSLEWNSSSLATSYNLQVSANNSFSSYIYNQNVGSSTYYQVTGLSNNTTYYWRVNASNSYGTSGWSTVRSFTTGSASTNGWITQTSPTSDNLYSVYFPGTSTGFAVGSYGTIINTTNGGTNWTLQTSGTSNTLLGVYFVSLTTGWAVGYNGTILKTTNSGSSWVTQSSGITDDLYAVCFTSSTIGYVGGYGGVILKTSDGGSTWNIQSSPTTSDLWSMYFTSSTTGWAVGQYGTIIKTTNSGSTWSIQNSNTSTLLNSICFNSSASGIAVGSNGIIVQTNDGGNNWSLQTSTVSSSIYWIHFYPSSSTGWAVGSDGLILKTTNGGSNWATQDSPTSNSFFSVFAASTNVCYAVGSSGTIIYTSSGGN